MRAFQIPPPSTGIGIFAIEGSVASTKDEAVRTHVVSQADHLPGCRTCQPRLRRSRGGASPCLGRGARHRAVRQGWAHRRRAQRLDLQGLGKDGKPPTREELQPLAKTNIDSLAEFDYFTFAREAGKKAAFQEPSDYWLDADEKKVVSLHFTVLLKEPIAASKVFSFQVYDPSYFVAFGFEKKDPVALKDAPAGCSSSVMEPAPLLAAESQRLSQAASENFSPGGDLSARLAPRVVVACP